MKNSNSMLMLAAGLALTVLVLGLASSDGKNHGPVATRDIDRLSDLRDLSGFVRCVAEGNDKTLPEALLPVSACGSKIRLADPFTGTPYGYEVRGPGEFRICAGFENAAALPDHWFGLGVFDRATGCATVPFGLEE